MTGLIGEEVVDDRVWIVKSHHPWRVRWFCKDFDANKILYCVRNPFDVILSEFDFLGSMTHSRRVANKYWEDEPIFFDEFVKFHVGIMQEYYDEMFKIIKARNIPSLFIKFE